MKTKLFLRSVQNLRKKEGIKVYPISAVSGQGVRELLFHVRELLAKLSEGGRCL